MFPSKEKVQCDYPNCTAKVRRDNLKQHLATHKDEPSYSLKNFFLKRKSQKSAVQSVSDIRNLEAPSTSRESAVQSVSDIRNLEAPSTSRESAVQSESDIRNLEAPSTSHERPTTVEFASEVGNFYGPSTSRKDNIYVLPVGVKKFLSEPAPSTTQKNYAVYYYEKLQKSFTSLFRSKKTNENVSHQSYMDSTVENLTVEDDMAMSTEEIQNVEHTGAKKRRMNSPLSYEKNTNVSEQRLKNIEDTLNLINEKIQKLSLNTDKNSSSVNTTTNSEIEKQKRLLTTAKSIKKILEYCPTLSAEDDRLICNLCFDESKKQGIFTYDVKDPGINHEFSVMPRKFSNLKSILGKHLVTESHLKSVEHEEEEKQRKEKTEARNYQIGKRLGRAAYKEIKKGGTYLDYEEQICVLAADKIDVGNILHSRKFVSDFEENVYEVLRERTKEILHRPLEATQKPTPFAVIADKVTPHRRTLEVVGIHGYIDGKFQSILAGVPEVEKEDGVGVTRTLKKGLENLGISDAEIESRCVGGAFDGEYFNLKIPQNLLTGALIENDAQEWYTFQWDPAHIIELAEHDSRKHKNSESIQKYIDVIGEVSRIFGHGKVFREAQEMCELRDTIVTDIEQNETEERQIQPETGAKRKFKAPKRFSNTRFATHSSKVLKTFLENYDIYYKSMNEKQLDELDNIDHAPFLFKIAALDSVYEVLGGVSNAVQKPEMLPWEVKSTLKTYLNTLDLMAEHLREEDLEIENLNKDLFPTLYKIASEVKAKGAYNGCAILDREHNTQRTRNLENEEAANCYDYENSLKIVAKDVAKFSALVSENAQTRFKKQEEKDKILLTCGNLFDITKVKDYDSHNDVKEDLKKYVELAKKTKNISPDVSLEKIERQYDEFIQRVKATHEKFKFKPENKDNNEKVKINYPERIHQTEMYKKMYNTKDLHEKIEPVMHLSLTANCRTHCESVVEGMGSVLTANNEQRGNLSNKALERQAFIRWQGPEPSSENGTTLVENALDRRFGERKNWKFTTESNAFTVSKVIDRKKKEATVKEKISMKDRKKEKRIAIAN